jgi:cyclophilin family peptidyl-prolyl cis-trans isomerase
MLPLCRGVSLYLPLLVLLPLQLHGADAQAGSDNAVAATAQAQRELRSAAGSGDLVLLASAIQRGAKVDYKKGDGTTPLSEAARKGQAAAVVALLEAGATVDLRAAGQMTALMSAARLVDTAAMRALLAAGADPNLQAPNGWTALMYAAKDARRDGVAMLLESGADRTLKSASGKTALQWAQESGAPGVAEVVAMLESGGSAANGTSAEYVRCETQAWDPSGSGGAGGFVSGSFTLEMHREWAPLGYDRFMELVRRGFFTDNLIYRTIPGFLVQFGVSAQPALQAEYNAKPLQDDPKVHGLSFGKGVLSFAGSGRNSRTTHMFLADAPSGSRLGNAHHERPIGKIVDHPEIIDSFAQHGYGDISSLQSALVSAGNAAASRYPQLARIKRCEVQSAEERATARQAVEEGRNAARSDEL